MPTYEYVCDACSHEFELFQSMMDKPISTCPECKKRKVRRLIGAGAGVIFKGSGFYGTDYRSESYKKGEAAAKATSEKKSEGKAGDCGSCAANPSNQKSKD